MSSSRVDRPVQVTGKRKHHIIDLTEDDDRVAVTLPTMPTTLPATATDQSRSSTLPLETPSEEEDDRESVIEDFADYFEMAPYENGNLLQSSCELSPCRTNTVDRRRNDPQHWRDQVAT